MKRLVTTQKDRASKYLQGCDPESVEYVREFIDEIDNLTVVDFDGYDLIEVDPDEEIQKIQRRYVSFGIDEDLIDDLEEFEMIYEALCTIEDR